MTDQSEQVARAQADSGETAGDLVGRYLEGVALVRETVGGMSGEQLRARPIAGKMSSLEVLCHVADCDQFLADRMKRTIATEHPLLVGIDASSYPELLGYHSRDPEQMLALIALTREQMADDLSRLSEDAWTRTGVHTETGIVTLRQQMLHAIRHLEGHMETIREKRAALGL